MSTVLFPCGGCDRHVRAAATVCPFCGVAARAPTWEPPDPPPRLSRAALLAFATAVAAASCTPGATSTPEAGRPTGEYNPAPTPPRPRPVVPDPGLMVAVYGAPPPPAVDAGAARVPGPERPRPRYGCPPPPNDDDWC